MGMDLTREAIGFAAGAVSVIIFGGGTIYFINGRRTGTRFLVAGDPYVEHRRMVKEAAKFDMDAGSVVRMSLGEAKKAVKESNQVFGLKKEQNKIVKGKDDESVGFEDFAGLVQDNDKFKNYNEQERKDVWNAYEDNVRKKFGELCAEKLY